MKGYKRDLAYIHDVGFGGFAKSSAPALLDMIRSNGITGGLVVDLGCGSGIWAGELSKNGFEVLGIDISSSMIEIARSRVPTAQFRVGSLLKASIPTCVAVTSLGECFNYVFDPKNSLAELRKLFRTVFDALSPGGVFIFDIAEPGRGKGPKQKHVEGRDWAVLVDIEEDSTTNRLTRRIVTFRKQKGRFTRDEETHILQLYKRSEILNALREQGFRTRTLSSYGDEKMLNGCVGFLARKPGRVQIRS